jgi:hypothetical protein
LGSRTMFCFGLRNCRTRPCNGVNSESRTGERRFWSVNALCLYHQERYTPMYLHGTGKPLFHPKTEVHGLPSPGNCQSLRLVRLQTIRVGVFEIRVIISALTTNFLRPAHTQGQRGLTGKHGCVAVGHTHLLSTNFRGGRVAAPVSHD